MGIVPLDVYSERKGPQPPPKPLPANAEHYTKLEFTGFGGAISITHTSSGHLYVSGGASTLEPSASLMHGTIFPKKGKTADNVVQGWSGGGSGGVLFGAEVWGNSSGTAVGIGLTTPGGAGSATFGKPVGRPTAAAPAHKKPH